MQSIWIDNVYEQQYVSIQIALIDGWKLKHNEVNHLILEVSKVDMHGVQLAGILFFIEAGVKITYERLIPVIDDRERLAELKAKRLGKEHSLTDSELQQTAGEMSAYTDTDESPNILEIEYLTERHMSDEKRLVGQVKWFNTERGFGFILADDVNADIYVHYQNVPKVPHTGIRRLFDGQQVSFKLQFNQGRGYEALAVKIEGNFYNQTSRQ